MRVTEGLDSGPVALLRARCRSSPTTTSARSRPRLARARRRAARRGRSSCARAGELELTEQDDARGDLRGEDRARPSAASTPARPAIELERAGAGADTRTSAPTSSSTAASGSACARPRAERRRARAGDARRRRRRCVLGCGEGVLRLDRGAARRAAGRWTPTTTCAATASAELGVSADGSRRRGGLRLRGPAAHLRGRRLDRPRLRRRGARGTSSTAASAPRRGASPTARSSAAAPPTTSSRVLAGRRGGTDRRRRARGAAARALRAAVLRGPPTTPPSTRRSSWPRRASGAAARRTAARGRRPGSSTRSCAGPRASASELLAGARRLDPGGRRGRPLLPRLAGRDVVGGARRRRGAAADGGDERARRDGLSGQHPARRARRRSPPSCAAAGVEVTRPGAGGLLEPGGRRSSSTRAGEPVGARIATGELVPQSRGSQAVVALLDPRPGERVLDLCAGPGIKTTAIAARMADRGRGRLASRSTRGGPPRSTSSARRAGASCVAGARSPTPPRPTSASGYDRVLVDPPCSDLGTLASRPDARWRKSPEPTRARSPRSSGGSSSARRARCARAGRSSTRPARSRRRENEARRGGARRVRRRRRGRRPRRRRTRGSPRAATRASCSSCPTATAPTGFFMRPLRRRGRLMADRARTIRAPGVPGLRRAVAAADPAPGPLPLRLLPAPLRARLAVPELRRAPDDRADVGRRGPALPALRPLDAEPV